MEHVITRAPQTLDCLEVRTADKKGRGVFATAAIASGTFISPVSGWPTRTAELTDDIMGMQVGPDLWFCSHGEFLDDYINHSCNPNAGFSHGTPAFYAIRDIRAGEEITIDYSTSLQDDIAIEHCACGHPQCRDTIMPWSKLSPEIRARLLPFAMAYLRPSSNVNNNQLKNNTKAP